MNSPANTSSADHGPLPARFYLWLESRQATLVLLFVAACFSLPPWFSIAPEMGLDPSWQLSLQLAALKNKIFGQEFVFTYGPLGYLFIHAAVNKAALLLYDFFVLASLLSIYRKLLPARLSLLDAFLLVGLAVVTKACLSVAPAAVLFTILCYWLWQIYDRGNALSVIGSLVATVVLFFGKVNYGLIVIFLMPAYGIGLLIFRRDRVASGILLLAIFPVLIWLGAIFWHVNLPDYLRSGIELIAGYNEAMFRYSPSILLVFELALLFLLAMALLAFFGGHFFSGKARVMLLPLIGLAAFLLFKNAFVRSDEEHNPSFYDALPLLLAVWCIGWRNAVAVRILLLASLFYPLALLTAETKSFGRAEILESTPLRYCYQAVTVPRRASPALLEKSLRKHYPQDVFPDDILSTIGQSSVDVMPWESSLAVLNGLNYQPRPVPQSYSAYTPCLDDLNARFLASTNAPDYILYACAHYAAIDGRPAAWDESLTKRALLENYSFASEFSLSVNRTFQLANIPASVSTSPLKLWELQAFQPTTVFLLKRAPHFCRLIPVATNEVSLTLNQPLLIPDTTNLVFLTLQVNRSLTGKLKAAALSPAMLVVSFNYSDGTSMDYRAVLPILETGVLVSRRVESVDEIRNWLQVAASRNLAVSSICFKNSSAWSFRTPLKGNLVEYQLVRR